MILPKKFFDTIEYCEHTLQHRSGTNVFDVCTIHFNKWWKPRRKIKIKRQVSDYSQTTGMFRHSSTKGAADLYNQLNRWAIDTHEEKLDSVKQKYEKHDNHNNVLVMKPKPKDIDDDK